MESAVAVSFYSSSSISRLLVTATASARLQISYRLGETLSRLIASVWSAQYYSKLFNTIQSYSEFKAIQNYRVISLPLGKSNKVTTEIDSGQRLKTSRTSRPIQNIVFLQPKIFY